MFYPRSIGDGSGEGRRASYSNIALLLLFRGRRQMSDKVILVLPDRFYRQPYGKSRLTYVPHPAVRVWRPIHCSSGGHRLIVSKYQLHSPTTHYPLNPLLSRLDLSRTVAGSYAGALHKLGQIDLHTNRYTSPAPATTPARRSQPWKFSERLQTFETRRIHITSDTRRSRRWHSRGLLDAV